MKARWNPYLHDPILISLHGRGFGDHLITDHMLNEGHAVSYNDVLKARYRLKLPVNRAQATRYETKNPAPPKEKKDPLAFASHWLGSRLLRKPTGYWLDGLPASMTTYMKAANLACIAAGCEPLTVNPAWL